MSFTSLTLL